MAASKRKKKVRNAAQVTNNTDANLGIVEVRGENLAQEEKAEDNNDDVTRKRVSTAPAEEVVGANGEEKSDDDCEEDQSDHVGDVDTGGQLQPRRGGVMSDANMLKEAKLQLAKKREKAVPLFARQSQAPSPEECAAARKLAATKQIDGAPRDTCEANGQLVVVVPLLAGTRRSS
jgi:hypothetical protein